MEQAQKAYDDWAGDAQTAVRLGQEKFADVLLSLNDNLEEVRRAFYDLDDPGLAVTTVVHIDGRPYLYEQWGQDPERDRQHLAAVIKSVSLAKADPKRRRHQPIAERVTVEWAGS